MSSLIEKIALAAEKFNFRLDNVVAALSGGADSVSLLLALKEMGADVKACHLNHGLRGDDSDSDQRFCIELCRKLGVELFTEKVNCAELAEKHESGEECARRVRYDFFERALEHFGGNSVIATAHTADDNLETVLLNLTRGTGLKGLCGIPPQRGRIIRPLLLAERREVIEYLAEKGQDYVTDKSNFSEDYSRNRIRLNVIPELKKLNPSLAGTVSRMTGNVREDSDYLEEKAAAALEKCRAGRGYDAAALAEYPLPVKSRAVRTILREGGIEPSALRINTALELLTHRSGRFNPCKNRFFTVRKGICFVEETEQKYNHRNEKTNLPIK